MTEVRRIVGFSTFPPGEVFRLYNPRTGASERVEFVPAPRPWELRRCDGGWSFHEPLTGVCATAADAWDAWRVFCTRLRARRSELRAREPESLDERERLELEKLELLRTRPEKAGYITLPA